MWTESPLIEVWVNRPDLDVIHISTENGVGWKIDGFKGDELVPPDELQDHFNFIVRRLAQLAGDDAKWINTATGAEISSWEAMRLLTLVDDEDTK